MARLVIQSADAVSSLIELKAGTNRIGRNLIFGLAAMLILTIGGGGYLFSFMQRIIVSSANGEEAMPVWPEIQSVVDDLVLPFFRYLAIWLLCLMPGVLALRQASPVIGYALLLGACSAFPWRC